MLPDQHGRGPWISNLEPLADRWRTRPGWGQVSQFDTTLAFHSHLDPVHLGSHLIVTDFGHEQIVSVQSVRVFTGGLAQGTMARRVGLYAPTYLLSVYDVTTGHWWEEILAPRTQEQIDRNDRRRARYETDLEIDTSTHLAADTEPFFFHEFKDTLYLGSRRAGLWAYIPADFGSLRTQQLDSIEDTDWHVQAWGESSLVARVPPSPGPFADAVAYLTSGEFPRPSDVSDVQGRLVLVDRRTLWFSDVGRPGSVAADNFVIVPSEHPITSVTEIGGSLLIHTSRETWLYLPPQGGFLISGGRLLRTSPEVGCLSPEAVVRGGGMAWWIDSAGAWMSPDGMDIRPAAPGWEEFWQSHVSDPLSQFWQQSGASAYAVQQPRAQRRFDATGALATWDHARRRLLLTFPGQAMSLVLEDGAGFVWVYESAAQPASTVAVRANLPGLRPLMGVSEMYAVLYTDTAAMTDDTLLSGLGAPDSTPVSVPSLAIVRLGRGGALDRSVQSDREDVRRLAGRWYSFGSVMAVAPSGDNAFRILPPVKVPQGFVYPNVLTPAGTQDWLLPIEVVPDTTMTIGPRSVTLIFDFDNTHWTPLLRPASTEVDFLLPAERLQSAPGYRPGAPTAGLAEVQVYSSATGLPLATGNQIRIRWDGTQAGYAASMYAPTMNLTPRMANRLMWIPMRYSGVAGDDVLRMGFLGGTGVLANAATPYTLPCDIVAWQEALHAAVRHEADDVAQPVDWALKSGQIGLKGQRQIRARTIWLSLRGSGHGAVQIAPTATHGLLNAVFSSDDKGWAAQIVDHDDALQRDVSKDTLRSRLRNLAGEMADLTWGSANTEWGDLAVAAEGNVLMADRPVDTLAISDAVKGEHVSIMVFGHVRNRAEGLDIGDARVSVIPTSGRRRVGR